MRALVVDDSPAARAQALSCLEDALDALGADAEVLEADGGVAAMGTLARLDVDILIVDLHMPDLTGIEVLRFWAQRRTAPGIAYVVTTEVSAHDLEKIKEAGAEGFLEKPISVDVLREALAASLGSAP